MPRKIWLIVFLLVLNLQIYGQSFFLKHYSVEDGLLSSEIYDQLQDKDGYMWFATSRGVSRFDGLSFTNYTVSNGLATNSIITMFIDQVGRIWFAGYDGTLSYFENNKIRKHKYLNLIKRLAKSFYINNLYVDEDFNLYIAPNRGGLYKVDSNGNVLDLLKNYSLPYSYFIQKIGNELFIVKTPYHRKKFEVFATDSALFFNVPLSGLRRFATQVAKSSYILSIGKDLYLFSPDTIQKIKTYPNEISGIYLDKNNNLWVSVLYTGVFIYKNLNFNDYYFLLERKSPITIYQDNEMSYWIPTTESGVYYLPSFNFYNYKEYGFSDFNIIAIDGINKDIYFSTFDQQLFHCVVNKNAITGIEVLKVIPNKNITFNDILASKDGNIWLLGHYLVKYSKNFSQIICKLTRPYSLAQTDKGDILATTSNGFVRVCNKTKKICFSLKNSQVPTSNSIFQDKNGIIWLGSINGLFSYFNDSLYSWGNVYNVLKTRINDINQFHNYILLATSGAGLLALCPKDSLLINITTKQGLTSDFITKIFIQDTVIWVGTNKGLAKITVTDSINFKYHIENFTHYDGLFAEEIRDITMVDSTIFLATSKGLVSFFPSKLKKQFFYPSIIIDSITIDDIKINFDTIIKLKPRQNILTIYFKAISFRSGRDLIYRYKIQGYDDTWNITKNRYIRLPKLPSGKYTLYLQATAQPFSWAEKSTKFHIIKKPKFTQTPLFFVLTILLLIGIIALISHIRITTKQKQLEHERQLMLVEQRALRSQMNPHFIFNALNSIRRYILENEIDKADYYLTSFATLMRKVLDNSKQNFITLDQEISTLKLYLELEKMRFDDSFNFYIYVDENLDIHNWYIPPMLIQPFAENAIWHGLALKPSKGKLQIFFKYENQKLVCSVEDNGIGRQRASQIAAKRKGHKSTGLANIKERIQLLYKLYGKKINLQIIDLYDKQNQPAGTKVIVEIPDFSDVSLKN